MITLTAPVKFLVEHLITHVESRCGLISWKQGEPMRPAEFFDDPLLFGEIVVRAGEHYNLLYLDPIGLEFPITFLDANVIYHAEDASPPPTAVLRHLIRAFDLLPGTYSDGVFRTNGY